MAPTLRAVIPALVLAAALAGCASGDDPGTTPTTAAAAVDPATDQTAAPATATQPPSRPLELGDGIYDVGTDIQAGAYTATAGARPCYWARLRSFGRADSIIDEDNLDPGETQTVVVQATDRGFKASNGCRWRPAAK
ncbi:hypothetical protein ACH4T9_20015 [Micromonospora sp. NPDC020750]|uniref:hypothetical protein n=1 Tax=unclassified Micromonospora TaxID=2617518 RepID=UPI00378F68A5